MKPLLAAVLGASLAAGAHAAEQKLPAELLEFLGSLDDAEAGWQEYLARTDVTKLPKPKRPPADKGKTDTTKVPP